MFICLLLLLCLDIGLIIFLLNDLAEFKKESPTIMEDFMDKEIKVTGKKIRVFFSFTFLVPIIYMLIREANKLIE